MMPVQSEVTGRVVEVLAPDGSAVEYDTPLMLIDPVANGTAGGAQGALTQPARPDAAAYNPARPV